MLPDQRAGASGGALEILGQTSFERHPEGCPRIGLDAHEGLGRDSGKSPSPAGVSYTKDQGWAPIGDKSWNGSLVLAAE